MKKSTRKFRLNFVIVYDANTNINNYQTPLHAIFKSLAWLYKLEYAIASDNLIADDAHLTDQDPFDLVYLRSTESTCLDAKTLRKIILDMFPHSNLGSEGVDVWPQLYKALPIYPFPKNYIRPLNYPYLEVHQEGQKSVSIPYGELVRLVPELKDAD